MERSHVEDDGRIKLARLREQVVDPFPVRVLRCVVPSPYPRRHDDLGAAEPTTAPRCGPAAARRAKPASSLDLVDALARIQLHGARRRPGREIFSAWCRSTGAT